MTLEPLPAFNDNYIWMLHDGIRSLVVDPGDAQPVLQALQAQCLQLDGILVTHHHGDHVGGIHELLEHTRVPVWGAPTLAQVTHPVRGGDTLCALGMHWQVLALPGHTLDHLGYYLPPCPAKGLDAPLLMCGDTLFSAGCGRLFEGSMQQLYGSLQCLDALDAGTQVCCAHEYTLANLRFAAAVEPDNADIAAHLRHCQALREQLRPTLPSTLGLERRINPFLRCHTEGVQRSARAQHAGADTPEAVFAALRTWKNHFA
ncbi:MAG: hydroxyacylglutathione hydrolase [Rhodoferax sp.]